MTATNILIMVRSKKEEALSDGVAPVLVDLVAHSRLRAGFLAECEQVALCQVVAEEILMWRQNHQQCCSTSQHFESRQHADGCTGCAVGCLVHGKKGGALNDFLSHHCCHHTHHHSHHH